MKKNEKASARKSGRKAWIIVTSIVLAVMVTATVLCTTTFRSILDTVLGGKRPIMASQSESVYKSDYATKEEAKLAGDQLNLTIAKEGFTLLVNEGGALPLASGER